METKGTGLVGCGAMGSAMVKGLVKGGVVEPDRIMVYDINDARKDELAGKIKVSAAGDLEQLILGSRVILIAVKPRDVDEVMRSMKNIVGPNQMLISVAAGITTEMLERYLPEKSKVIRVMPNTPCLIGEGALAVSPGRNVTPGELEQAVKLLEPLGLVVTVPEDSMDGVTGLSGSGPAYVYLFAEALIDAGVDVGLGRKEAGALVIQTLLGASRMLKEAGKHPAQLRNEVTSPGGTTSAALKVLDEEGFRGLLIKAVNEASRRAGEMKSDGK